jgi:hypothetical protein
LAKANGNELIEGYLNIIVSNSLPPALADGNNRASFPGFSQITTRQINSHLLSAIAS